MTNQDRQSRALAVPSGRLARFTRLGSMTAGVAGNMALQGVGELGHGRRPNFRSLLMTPQNMSRIADRLAEMRGAAMKIGQLVSMDTGDVLPPELAHIMARLRDDAHFMPPAQLKRVLNEQWPAGWIQQIKTFDVHPIAAASIGQVHRAKLKDGRDLAIKVQYPGVARSIDSDVANVGALIRMSGLLPKGFVLAPYLEEARQQLHEETDYLRECAYLGEFRELLQEDARFVLPELHHDWTTTNILSMSFVDGAPIEQAASEPQDLRDAIAQALVELVLRELFDFGLMQTDPNFANYRYDPETGRVVLLDFGATRRIDPNVVAQYRDLMRAGLDRDRQAMEQVSMQIGFFTPHTHARHRQRILDMMELAFSALLEDGLFDFSRTDVPRKLQQEGMVLAQEGFVPPPLPIDVLFLQRKFGGVFLLAAKLGVRIAVKDLLMHHL